MKTLVYSITGVSSGDLQGCNVGEAYNSPVSTAILEVTDTTLDLGDAITISLGFGSPTKVFQGYVVNIERSIPSHLIQVTCEDVLTKATNYFIASDDPDNPIEYSNILSEDYVENVLALAEITNYEADVPGSFTWATDLPAEVNLVTSYQAANEMAQMLAWHIHADRDGKVWFNDRRPYIQGGDSSSFSWDETAGTDVLRLSYSKSTEELRNKVVVYGREGVQATASSVSPYLYSPTYYKTAVIAHPLIQTGSLAQTTADYNLELYNRLTEVLAMEVEGDPDITARAICTVTGSAFSGIGTSDWFIYSCRHNFGVQGYTVSLNLTK
ncbi:MAG: hypothetical protein ACERKJ_09620 [Candidatus Dadabacteria bacterium]